MCQPSFIFLAPAFSFVIGSNPLLSGTRVSFQRIQTLPKRLAPGKVHSRDASIELQDRQAGKSDVDVVEESPLLTCTLALGITDQDGLGC